MATSRIAVLKKQFADAQAELEAAADTLKSHLDVLVKRGKQAELLGTGFVIALAAGEKGVTHGSVRDAHLAFHVAVQRLESIRKEARQLARENETVKILSGQKAPQKEEAPKAEAPATKKAPAKKPAAKKATKK